MAFRLMRTLQRIHPRVSLAAYRYPHIVGTRSFARKKASIVTGHIVFTHHRRMVHVHSDRGDTESGIT